MDRGEVYAALARELWVWEGRPASERVVRVGGEDVTVRVSVRWGNERRGTLRVEAVADGPSWWRLERLEESAIVGRGQSVEE